MPYKSIDLQTSIPRAAELTPMAQHQQHRAATDQALLAQQSMKTAEQQAQRKTKTESASKGGISDRQPRGGGGRQQASAGKRSGGTEQEEPNRSEHPYKGKHIDFTG